jgi:non-specific serine/threonine protein kinase
LLWPPPGVALPRPRTTLIGRDEEVVALNTMLEHGGTRLLTLIGPGGVGKTRLAIAVADAVRGSFADGVAYVPLAAVPDPVLVCPTLARQLGVREEAGLTRETGLLAALRERHLLLVLDNLEHLVPAALLVARLLQASPRLVVLATSRAPLHLSGERLFLVPVLTPPHPTTIHDVKQVRANSAVRLFVERAAAARPGFNLTDESAAAIAEICRRLDGLPLALELAAAHARADTPAAILNRLDRPLVLLSGGPPDVAPRHRTLRSTIAWSHDLLTPDDQILFRSLAVFPAGFTLDAAEAIGGKAARRQGGEGKDERSLPPCRLAALPPSVLDGLAALLDHSLIHDISDAPAAPRYAMLETIRDFARQRLAASDEWVAAHDRLADWCLDLMEREEPHPSRHPEPIGFELLDAELSNLRAALAWLRDSGDTGRGFRLVTLLKWFLTDRGHLAEVRAWFDAFLALPIADALLPQRAAALGEAADVAHWQNDYAQAEALFEAALTILRRLDDPGALARILIQLGHVRRARADAPGAAGSYREALTLADTARDPTTAAQAAAFLGRLVIETDLAAGLALLDDAVSRLRDFGSHWLSIALQMLAMGRLLAGDLAGARASAAECLALAAARDDHWRVATLLAECAEIAHRAGALQSAARLFGASAHQRAELGISLHPDTQALHDGWLAALRRSCGEQLFVIAWAEGEALSREAAIAEARLAVAGRPAPSRDTIVAPAIILTRREREVLALLAAGASNREIAEALSLAHRTAETHVRRLCHKLGVESRTAAVATAFRLGLIQPSHDDTGPRPS